MYTVDQGNSFLLCQALVHSVKCTRHKKCLCYLDSTAKETMGSSGHSVLYIFGLPKNISEAFVCQIEIRNINIVFLHDKPNEKYKDSDEQIFFFFFCYGLRLAHKCATSLTFIYFKF